jgi:AcrR family transcriptional regulator
MTVKSRPRSYQSDVRAAGADETRSRVIAAACALLTGGKDLPAFSVDSVARHAAVTRLTVYNKFESKRGLLEAVFDHLARQGGLFDLREVLSRADDDGASVMRRFVAVFCRFWALHGAVIAKLGGLARLDEEIAESLEGRAERRRHGLTMLIGRMPDVTAKSKADLVDVLFALTSYEMWEFLAVRPRSTDEVEELLQELVTDAVKRFSVAPPKRVRASRPKRKS